MPCYHVFPATFSIFIPNVQPTPLYDQNPGIFQDAAPLNITWDANDSLRRLSKTIHACVYVRIITVISTPKRPPVARISPRAATFLEGLGFEDDVPFVGPFVDVPEDPEGREVLTSSPGIEIVVALAVALPVIAPAVTGLSDAVQ